MSKVPFDYNKNIKQCEGCAYWMKSTDMKHCHFLLKTGRARSRVDNGDGTDTCYSWSKERVTVLPAAPQQSKKTPSKPKPVPKTDKDRAVVLAEYVFGDDTFSGGIPDDIYDRIQKLLQWLPEDKAGFMWMTTDGVSNARTILNKYPNMHPVNKYKASIRNSLLRISGFRNTENKPTKVDWDSAIFRYTRNDPIPSNPEDVPIIALDLSPYIVSFLVKVAPEIGHSIVTVDDIIELYEHDHFDCDTSNRKSVKRDLTAVVNRFAPYDYWAKNMAKTIFRESAFALSKPKDLDKRLETMLTWVSEKDRETLLMHFRDGKSNQEINEAYPDPQPQRKVRYKIGVLLRRISGFRYEVEGKMFLINWSAPIFTIPKGGPYPEDYRDLPTCAIDIPVEAYGYLTRMGAERGKPVTSIGDILDVYAVTDFKGLKRTKKVLLDQLAALAESWEEQKKEEAGKEM